MRKQMQVKTYPCVYLLLYKIYPCVYLLLYKIYPCVYLLQAIIKHILVFIYSSIKHILVFRQWRLQALSGWKDVCRYWQRNSFHSALSCWLLLSFSSGKSHSPPHFSYIIRINTSCTTSTSLQICRDCLHLPYKIFPCVSQLIFQAKEACPEGRYRAETEGTSVASCDLCPAGKHCPSEAHDGTTFLECTAGYYCAAGSTGSQPVECRAGYYCPGGKIFK